MKTIQMTLDDDLVSEVDEIVKQLALQRNLKNKPLIVPWLTC